MKKKITLGTLARTAALAVGIIATFLGVQDKIDISIAQSELYDVFSWVYMVYVAGLGFWKNNSFTEAAIYADEALARKDYQKNIVSISSIIKANTGRSKIYKKIEKDEKNANKKNGKA